MKTIHIYKCLMISFVMVLLLGSCTKTEVESKFDKNATERLSSRQKELNDLLLSSAEGWKAVYYTDSTQLGGWTHLFKFLPEGKVNMASDFDADTTIHTSQYEIQVGSTVSLVFTTANRIHLLSDAANYPTPALLAKGYLGDFQFFYYGQKDGDIIFKTNRNNNILRFVKATAKDWTDLPKNTPIIEAITGNELNPLYRLLTINDGTTIQNYDFDYNSDARFGVASSLVTGSKDILNVALAFTPTGATTKPPIVVKGQKLSNFNYNSVDNTFVVSGTDGISATIKFSSIPPRLTDDYKILLPGQPASRFGYYPDDTTADAPTNSKEFKNALANANELLGKGNGITTIQIYFNHKTLGNFVYYTFNNGDPFMHKIDVVEDAVGKKIILKHKSGNVPASLVDLDKYFVNPNGIYVKKEAFKLGYSNAIYTFTSASSSFRMTTYKL